MHRRTQNLGKDLATEKVGQLPLKDVVFVSKDTALFGVFEVMRAAKSGCALVQDGDKVIGIFTERDVLTRVVGPKISLETPIEAVMSPDPKTLSIDSTIVEALRVMNEGGYRNIPLTAQVGGKVQVTKILSIRDLVNYFGSNFPEEVYNLPPDPQQTQQEREGA